VFVYGLGDSYSINATERVVMDLNKLKYTLSTKHRPSTAEVPQEIRSTSVEVKNLIKVLNVKKMKCKTNGL